MKDIFILGSGFSKAISENSLPTMDEMTIDIINLKDSRNKLLMMHDYYNFISNCHFSPALYHSFTSIVPAPS